MSISLHMYAILGKPSNLPNKINFEQRQDVPGGFNLLWAPSLDTGQKSRHIFLQVQQKVNVGKSLQFGGVSLFCIF